MSLKPPGQDQRVAAHAERINGKPLPTRGDGYPCPFCKAPASVIDTRSVDNGRHRLRRCTKGHRFATFEKPIE